MVVAYRQTMTQIYVQYSQRKDGLTMKEILDNMNLKKILSQKEGFKRFNILLCSIVIMGFAVAVFSFSGMGVDPFTAMNMSVSSLLGVGFGLYQMCINAVILIAVAYTAKKLISVGTVVNMAGVGFVCEYFTGVFKAVLPAADNFIYRTILMVIGVLLLSFSASLYFKCNMGVSPYDALGMVMEEKLKLKYKWCRVFTDLVCTGVALVLGGPIGIGTVITALFMGPIVSFCNGSISKKIIEHKYRLLHQFTVIRYYDYTRFGAAYNR